MTDFTNILGKITGNADKLGGLAGFFVGTPNGVGDFMSALTNMMQGNIHVPDVKASMSALMGEGNVTKGIMAAIAGYVVDAVDPPLVGKYGKAIQKAGIGFALGAVAIKLFWMSTHADLGSDPTKPGYNPNWMRNGSPAPVSGEAGYGY